MARSDANTMRRPSGVQTGQRSSPGSKVNCVSVSRAHSYTQMSRCLPSEMSSASFWPSGENRGFAQSAFVRAQHRRLAVARHPVDRARGRRRPCRARTRACPRTTPPLARRPRPEIAATPSSAGTAGPIVSRRVEIEGHREERALLHVDQMAASRSRHVAGRSARTAVVPPRTTTFGAPPDSGATTRLAASKLVASPSARCRAPPCRRGAPAATAACAAPRLSVPKTAGVPPAAETRISLVLGALDRREDDRVVVGPRAAAAASGVAQRDRGAAGDRDLLQLAAGEERDPLAVRREERIRPRPRCRRARPPATDRACGRRARVWPACSRDKRERRPVRRQNRRRADGRSAATRRRRCWRAACAARARARVARAPTVSERASSADADSAGDAPTAARAATGDRASARWPRGRRGASSGAPASIASSSSRRASPMSRSRCLRVAIEAAARAAAERGGVAAGSASSVSVVASAPRASVSETSSPSNGALPGEHLVEHDAERPDVRALVDGLALAPAPAPCRPPCRGSCPPASWRGP